MNEVAHFFMDALDDCTVRSEKVDDKAVNEL